MTLSRTNDGYDGQMTGMKKEKNDMLATNDGYDGYDGLFDLIQKQKYISKGK